MIDPDVFALLLSVFEGLWTVGTTIRVDFKVDRLDMVVGSRNVFLAHEAHFS